MTTMIEGTTVQQVSVFTLPVHVLRDLATAAVAAGKDDYLPTLTGVLLEWHGTGMRAVATDRFRLAVIDYWDRSGEWPTGQFHKALVPAKELSAYVKGLPRPRRGQRTPDMAVITPGEGEVTFTCVHDGGELSRTIRTLDGEFPKYQGLTPDTFADLPADGIAMSARYLADIDKLPEVGQAQAGVRVQFTGPNKPMLWCAGDAEKDAITWTYLLMPMRQVPSYQAGVR